MILQSQRTSHTTLKNPESTLVIPKRYQEKLTNRKKKNMCNKTSILDLLNLLGEFRDLPQHHLPIPTGGLTGQRGVHLGMGWKSGWELRRIGESLLWVKILSKTRT